MNKKEIGPRGGGILLGSANGANQLIGCHLVIIKLLESFPKSHSSFNSIAGSNRSDKDACPPLRSKFVHFHALWELAPHSENPGSTTELN